MSIERRRRLFIVRHGETEWNHNTPGYCGWSDIALNDKGRRQAEAVGLRLASEGIGVVLCSDLMRAKSTAEAIQRHHPESRLFADPAFREVNYGAWEGRSETALAAEDVELFRSWKADPENVSPREGETLRQVLDRSLPALEGYLREHTTGHVALVAHKTTVRVLLCAFLGLQPRDYLRLLQQNAAVNVVEIREGGWVIAGINDTSHLPGELCSPAL